ncbi:MAG: heme ABC exporter ATP-binding protein CcmA [Ponticaulis sp.]|nr:heme ABC exporter ATP-binding protein CcmA [Ponticaulis sp.]
MALKLRQLTAVRGYTLLFSGLDFDLAYGEFAALKGPNGAGKTTLLRMVAGLIAAESGEIEYSIPDEAPARGIYYLGHELGLRPNETPLSHLRDWADMHHQPRERILPAIDRLGLTSRREVPAWSLSAGQKKRVALARSLVVPCPIWLLDEPASSLDVGGQCLLCELMTEHLNSNGAILAALHDPMDLEPSRVLDVGAFAP